MITKPVKYKIHCALSKFYVIHISFFFFFFLIHYSRAGLTYGEAMESTRTTPRSPTTNLDLTAVDVREERLHQIHFLYNRPALIVDPARFLHSHPSSLMPNASQLSHLIPFSLAHSLLPLPLSSLTLLTFPHRNTM